MNGKTNMLDNILKCGQKIYCKTQEEVDYFMDVAEAKGLLWVNGNTIRRHYTNEYPIIYIINGECGAECVSCSYPPSKLYICKAIPASELRNYVISIRNKRS